MDSGNGCLVAENPATVTRSSGQTTCDAGGDDGAMLVADKECSETEHQTDDKEVTDDDEGGDEDDDDEDETEDEDEAEEVVVVVVVFILIRKPNGQICPMKRWRMQIESSNK